MSQDGARTVLLYSERKLRAAAESMGDTDFVAVLDRLGRFRAVNHRLARERDEAVREAEELREARDDAVALSDVAIDTSFYPVTDRVDWGPLKEAGIDPDGWMFMEATTNGWRYYKHSETRERLVLKAGDDA